MRELISGLPRCDLFQQHFSPTITNCLPFQWQDFDATVRYTYRLNEIADLDAVWHGLRSEKRTAVRKAQREVEVRRTPDVDAFLALNRGGFAAKGMRRPTPTRR